MFDQTGDFYYHDKDAEGNPIGVPFTEIPNAGFLPQLEGLIKLYQFHYEVLRDELGEDPNLITQAAQPRVAVQNIETSQEQSDFALDQYYRGYQYVINDTAKKVSCLLKDSVTMGSAVYRKTISQEDIEGRVFTTKAELLPDKFKIQRFEAGIQQAFVNSPELALFLDPSQIVRIAERNVKLAESLYRQATKKMLIYQQQQQQQNQQATIQGQVQSAQAAEQAKGQNLQKELTMKAAISEHESKVQQENIATTGLWTYINTRYAPQKGTGENATVTVPPLPPDIQKLIEITVANNINQFMQAQQPEQQEAPPQEQQEQQQEPQEQQTNNQPQIAA